MFEPRRRPRPRHLLLLAVVGLGLSSTVFLDFLSSLTSPSHLIIYHLSGSPSTVFVPAIADVLALWAICFLALLLAEQSTALHRILWSLILCLYPAAVAGNIYHLRGGRSMPKGGIAILAVCGVAVLLLTLYRSQAANRFFTRIQPFGMTLLAAAGVAGAFALVETTWFAVEARHLNDQVVTNDIAHTAAATPHGRVIWIVLDELAYHQLYGRRLEGLQLPAFDQFRAQSTDFSNVQPAGIQTEIVLPALMTGDEVDRIQSTAEGTLLIHDARGWRSFDQRDTVFADADALGYRTSIVGWFNPYCRILPNVLDSCFWVNHSVLEGFSALDGFSADRGQIPNLLYPLQHLAEKLPSFLGLRRGLAPADIEEGKGHIRDFVELDGAADAALSDSRNNFLFLHMPVPHPSGIWDRRTDQFAVAHSSYVDNLVLADAYLAHVRHLLEARGQWEGTTVVIMGDHAWRTHLFWKGTPAWNRDDELASDGGQFDPRPAYLIKLPYQHTPATVQTAFPAIRTRSLLDQLLLGQITNPAQLEQWVDGTQPTRSAQIRHATQPRRGDHS